MNNTLVLKLYYTIKIQFNKFLCKKRHNIKFSYLHLNTIKIKFKIIQDRVIRRDKIQKEIMKRRSFVKSSLESGNVEGLEYNEKAARVYK